MIGDTKKMISIITWDAGFRENYHTVDSFCRQNYNVNDFEFIWVEFYSYIHPTLANKINSYPNARLLCLNNAKTTKWHLGKCLNAGIKASKGKLLVIPDGDIIVPSNLLKIAIEEHQNINELVLYFRRWDEPENKHREHSSYDINYLDEFCHITNPTNYAGCLSIKKKHILKVNGYEESPVFSGPGISGKELYIRLRNRGYAVKWHPFIKVFHPYHNSSGSSSFDKISMKSLTNKYQWLIPYAGIEQSWVLRCRELDLTFQADENKITEYLLNMPKVISPQQPIKNGSRLFFYSILQRILKI